MQLSVYSEQTLSYKALYGQDNLSKIHTYMMDLKKFTHLPQGPQKIHHSSENRSFKESSLEVPTGCTT